MGPISKIVVAGTGVLALALLFTPYEPLLEGTIALIMLAAAITGFVMHPSRDVYYVRTSVPLKDIDGNRFLEHDFVAIKVELVRLWLLFVPTFLAMSFLVFFAARGPVKFSFLSWLFSSRYGSVPLIFLQYSPLFVLVLLSALVCSAAATSAGLDCSQRTASNS